MIKNNILDVLVSNRNVSKFKLLGYECVSGEICKININDVSGVFKVPHICDKCGIEYVVTKDRISKISELFCKNHRNEANSEARKAFWNSDKGKVIRLLKGPKISKSKLGKGIKPLSLYSDSNLYHKYSMDVRRQRINSEMKYPKYQISNILGYVASRELFRWIIKYPRNLDLIMVFLPKLLVTSVIYR